MKTEILKKNPKLNEAIHCKSCRKIKQSCSLEAITHTFKQ